jgi:hypothetical protein
VAAVVGTLLPKIVPPTGSEPDANAFALAYVLTQIERMPAHLRTALIALETIFDTGAIARYGRPSHLLGSKERGAYLDGWENAKIGTQRDFVRFHRSLTIFALYSKWTSAP